MAVQPLFNRITERRYASADLNVNPGVTTVDGATPFQSGIIPSTGFKRAWVLLDFDVSDIAPQWWVQLLPVDSDGNIMQGMGPLLTIAALVDPFGLIAIEHQADADGGGSWVIFGLTSGDFAGRVPVLPGYGFVIDIRPVDPAETEVLTINRLELVVAR
jgi:hypothetical protein